jgi:hypothetical protein
LGDEPYRKTCPNLWEIKRAKGINLSALFYG